MASTTRFGGAHGSCIVANQPAMHYLAARDLLQQSRSSPHRHVWLYSQIITACAETIENIIGRVTVLNEIERQQGEKSSSFRPRALRSAGIHLQGRSITMLKEIIDYWNRHKHSGKGDEWIKNMKADTETFAIEAFNLAGAILSAYYRQQDCEADWIKRAEATKEDLQLTNVNGPAIDRLIQDWDIELRTP